METPSFKEDHISQIPALLMLIKMGYNYLSPSEALQLRKDKTSNVLLEPLLKEQLKKLNTIIYKGKEHPFSEANIDKAIQALKNAPLQEGFINANYYIYNLLILGIALEQSIEGDKKSFTLKYIDWEKPAKNIFHVTEEYGVMRSASHEHYRPDIVLFVNGIPLVVIECKRPDIKEPIEQAISQNLRNQQEDGIRPLFIYSQIAMALAVHEARFATAGTQEKFWSIWKERFADKKEEQAYQKAIGALKNKPVNPENTNKLFADRFHYVKNYFEDIHKESLQATVQDEYLYNLCRPNRLLDLTFNFVVYEAGEKKIARYQQYFAIKKTMQRVTTFENGRRKGGVIWHTQGSGKSLTMVMLAEAIALEKSIRNPKIILVTDRIDLDDQLTETFKKSGKLVHQATTGSRLVELLNSKSDAIITTVINKFEAAVKSIKKPLESPDIFTMVDEGHRSQYGNFNINMQKVFSKGCFIAFTGTPLMKKEKNTAYRFGGIIDTYTIDTAVEDKAVVPLLFEGRHALQKVQSKPVDHYFEMVSEPLTEYQKADLKKKFSRAEQLNVADQKVYSIAWDISSHFEKNWKETGFKGQLVCQSKVSAIKYKDYLDEIGLVSNELLISPPDEREGSESAYEEPKEEVQWFWKKMMQEHGNAKTYEKNIISRFKNQAHPEIIIVVDKLLTGFDAPRNTVLYITRNLKEHSLLQAIARVNRVFPGKDYGYIIDYYGILGELDQAMETYTNLENFDEQDLAGTITTVKKEIEKLPQVHSELWEFFKGISNKYDETAYEELLRAEDIRMKYYDKLSEYSRILKLALSTLDFQKETPDGLLGRYKEDARFFLNLRASVKQRYSDVVDYKAYEKQIQKLIDKHIESSEVKPITELVNIFDREKFQQEVEKIEGAGAKADMIASRTARHINDKMEEDPHFYKKFSELLKETIHEYEMRRISEAEYLTKVKEITESVLKYTDSDIPGKLKDKIIAQAFYGITLESLINKVYDIQMVKNISVKAGLAIDNIIKEIVLDNGSPVIDWQYKSDITGKLFIDIGDFLIDEIRDKNELNLTFEELDEITSRCIDIAKLRYK